MSIYNQHFDDAGPDQCLVLFFKAAYSVTMNIFRKFYFLFKSFIKVELSYVFTIKCSVQLKSAWESELSYQIGVFFSCW